MTRRAAALSGTSQPRAPMADNLIDAATRIIVRDGYEALTVQAIEREVGASRSLIHYHFGGKTGLLLAVADTVFRDMGEPPPEARGDVRAHLAAEVESDRALSADRTKMRLFFELLPHMLRTEELRVRLRTFYRRGHEAAGDDEEGRSADDRRRAAHQEHHLTFERLLAAEYGQEAAEDVGGLMAAMIDGLGLQALIDPEGVDHTRRFRVWSDMILTYLEYRRAALLDRGDLERP